MPFTMFVPIAALENHFHRHLSLPQWQEICIAARLQVNAAFSLDAMRNDRQIEWWDAEKLVVGQVTFVRKISHAEQLHIVRIQYGEPFEAVVLTSAASIVQFYNDSNANLLALRVPYAAIGAKMVDVGSTKDPKPITEHPKPMKKIRLERFLDRPSEGMVCSEREVGLSDEHDDIFLLPAEAVPGTALRAYLGNAALSLHFNAEEWKLLNLQFVLACITPQMAARELVGSSN